MLNKAMILHELAQAKIAHMRWVKRADHLISGMPVEEHFIPLEPTACGFGKWLYGLVGKKLRSDYIFESTIAQIESIHDELHNVYEEIYKIFYIQHEPRTFLQKFVSFGSQKVSKQKMEEAKTHFVLLQKYSRELIYQVEKLEKAVKAVDMVVLKRRHDTPAMFTQA